MSFYKLTLKYNGNGYQGWQKQAHTTETIQGRLDQALKKISKSDKVHTIGCGRTDSGVHALSQVVRAEIELDIDPSSLLKAINSNVPENIECIDCEVSSKEFNPVFDSKEKTYKYIFSTESRRNPHMKELITYIDKDLDLNLMQKACEVFVGEHDFSDFYTTGTEVSSTVRKIFNCKLSKIESTGFLNNLTSEYYEFEVTGTGFLKQMVRLMIGAVWNIGLGKVSIKDLENKLRNPDGEKLSPVAPPQGLYLNSVKY